MHSLDGYQVYSFFAAGSSRVAAARSYMDRINVFPVPDGDTGTNLWSTISGAIEATQPSASASATLSRLADAAIISARGNSGVIFAQFVAGLSEAIEGSEILAHELVAAAANAHKRARDAVMEPREGTILSTIETWAISLAHRLHSSSTISELIGSTREDLAKTLAATLDQLPALKKANVVDAGAVGFVEFIEGGHEFLLGRTTVSNPLDRPGDSTGEASPTINTTGSGHEHGAHTDELPNKRYCLETIVRGRDIDIEKLKSSLRNEGDCLIVAGNHRCAKVHIHVDDPSATMRVLSAFGNLTGQKADDMVLQYRDAHRDTKVRTAIVTDSSCDVSPELIEKFGIHVVPLLIRAGDNEYLDKLTIDARKIREYSESSGSFPRSSQPPAPFFTRLYANLSDYYEEVLAIHLSASMSGTYAVSAKEAGRIGPRISTHDSLHLSGSLGLIVLRAAEAALAGASKDEILGELPKWSDKARILVSVISLKYMVKGGRVSPLKGFLAQALNLKPIVSVDKSGKSILYGKAFSEKSNWRKIVKIVAQDHKKRPLRWYAIGHSGAPEKAARFASQLEAALGFPPLYVSEISAVVALNSGPGAVSVVTMAE